MMAPMTAGQEIDPEIPVFEAIQRGDDYAFRELLRRQDRWVRGVVFGVLGRPDRIDDVTQKVWTQVWKRSRELRDVSHWKPWLYRLARNAAIDAGRKGTRQRRFLDRFRGERRNRPATDPPADTTLARDEQHRCVLDVISSLPAMYREPFTLRHLEDWSYAQIGELLNLPVDTVETRLVRARRLLREKLDGKL